MLKTKEPKKAQRKGKGAKGKGNGSATVKATLQDEMGLSKAIVRGIATHEAQTEDAFFFF